MKTLEEALAEVMAATRALEAEDVALEAALGRFLSGEVLATIPLPPFDQSSMDGYAVVSADCQTGERALKVVGERAAGHAADLAMTSGEAVRIFTGGMIPRGADAVVMQEETRREEEVVWVQETVEAGEFIRRAGEEVCVGQKLAEKGEKIGVALLALIGSQGWPTVKVGRRPRVGILGTGDEIRAPGQALGPGQIYGSNSLMLSALLRQLGCEVMDLGVARDEANDLREKLAAGLELDALVISGGVSVGDRDLVKPLLQELGATQRVWGVALKPGKPFLFATHGECSVFGLPGNPVSSFVTWQLLVRPALLKMMGAREWSLPTFPATMGADYENRGTRPEFLRGRLANGLFQPMGRQESHALFGLSRANALVRVEPGQTLAQGEVVAALDYSAR